jgi:outer membrane protein
MSMRTAKDGSGRGARRSAWNLILAAALLALAAPAAAQSGERPAPDAGLPVLSLDDCIGLALTDSPTLLIAEERKGIASQDVQSAYGAFLPSITLGRTWQKSERTDFDIEQTSPAAFGLPTYDLADPNTQIGVTLFPTQVGNGEIADETINTKYKDFSGRASLNVFSGFSKFSTLSSAKNSLAAAEATRDYTRQLVVEDVVAAYYNLLRYLELLDVAIETRDQTQRELERTETYFRLGSAAKSDVLQQRVQLENTKLDVVVAENTVKKAFADLAYTMNRPLASAFTVDRSALETDFEVGEVSELYAEALANRLDLRSTEHQVEARRKDVTTASSNLWPSVDLFAGYTRYNNESPYRFGGQESDSKNFGYSVTWNVFDRLQTFSRRSQAKANARIAEYELDQARLNVQVEVRQLHNSLVEARERAKVSQESIVQSEEDLRLAQERFRVGAGTTLDVIVAQVNLANARAQEVQAKCDYLIARARMDRAVGRLQVAP